MTKTDAEFARKALKLFTELGLVEIKEDQTLYLKKVAKLLQDRGRSSVLHVRNSLALPIGRMLQISCCYSRKVVIK